jgi:amino acid permease
MNKSLTLKDIKELRYQCRMGYILPFFLFFFGTLFSIALYENLLNKEDTTNLVAAVSILLVWVFLAILISYKMNGKYYQDIRNNIKVPNTKIIQQKNRKRDFEAGSGNMTTLPHNNPMKEFYRYDFIVENTIYRVEKELFESCSEGDTIHFYYAPKSNYLLTIEKE